MYMYSSAVQPAARRLISSAVAVLGFFVWEGLTGSGVFVWGANGD